MPKVKEEKSIKEFLDIFEKNMNDIIHSLTQTVQKDFELRLKNNNLFKLTDLDITAISRQLSLAQEKTLNIIRTEINTW